jgi:cobalt-zinc-cadmium efflux system outer membrane protein
MSVLSVCSRSARILAIVFAAPLLPSIATAQTAPPHPSTERVAASQPTSLADILEETLRSSPELKAARARIVATASRPERADSLPDPTVSLVYRNVGFPEFTLGDEMMSLLGVRFTQAMPASGKRPSQRAVAERQIGVAEALAEATRRRLVQEATSTFFELLHVHEVTEVVDESRRLLLDLARTAESRYAVGEGIQQDVLKAQVEISVLLNQLVQLEQKRSSLEARLNRLMGRPAGSAFGALEAPDVALEQLPIAAIAPEAQAASASLRLHEQHIEEQAASVEMVRAERRPDWILSGAYMNRGGLTGVWEINVGVTLPIRKSSRQDLEIAENLEELNALRAERLDAAQSVDLLVYDSYLQADRAIRLHRLYRDAIIPQAALSLESAVAGYGVGKVDFLTVLDNVLTLLTYRTELAAERAAYARALARIEEHLGRSLGASPATIWIRGEEQ